MSVDSSQMAPGEDSEEDDQTQDELHSTRWLRRLPWLIPLLAVLLAGIWFGARPGAQAIKGWQSRRLAREAFVLIDRKEWKEATTKATDAYQLRLSEPESWRAIGRLLSRSGQSTAAFEWWKKLDDAKRLLPEDRRDYAEAALSIQNSPVAVQQVGWLLSQESANSPANQLLVSRLAALRGDLLGAAEGAEAVLRSADPLPEDTITAAGLLLSLARGDSPPYKLAVERLIATMRNNTASPAALDAASILARQPLPIVITSLIPGAPSMELIAVEELLTVLERNPLGKPSHRMLAWDVRVGRNFQDLPALVSKGLGLYAASGTKDLEARAAFSKWLNSHGQYEAVLQAIPPEMATSSSDLFLQRKEALSMLGRWAEVKEMLRETDFLLEPVVQQMNLATASAQLRETVASANAWERALEAAHDDVGKCLTLASYAESTGALEVANKALLRAIELTPRTRPAWDLRRKIAESRRDSASMLATLEGISALWPEDFRVANDLLYMRLLGKTDAAIATQASDVAETLLLAEPNNPQPKAMLALARLRLDDPVGALAAFGGLEAESSLSSAPAGVRAIWTAALAANGWQERAAAQAKALSGTLLWPEEQDLIRPLQNQEQ